MSEPDPAPGAPSTPSAATWVVCLCADWCGSCREYRTVFAQVAQGAPQLRFAWVDVEDHAEWTDGFDVQTFPTVVVNSPAGTHFCGPLLPHAHTLRRMLERLPPAQPPSAEVRTLMTALIRARPDEFEVAPG